MIFDKLRKYTSHETNMTSKGYIFLSFSSGIKAQQTTLYFTPTKTSQTIPIDPSLQQHRQQRLLPPQVSV